MRQFVLSFSVEHHELFKISKQLFYLRVSGLSRVIFEITDVQDCPQREHAMSRKRHTYKDDLPMWD